MNQEWQPKRSNGPAIPWVWYKGGEHVRVGDQVQVHKAKVTVTRMLGRGFMVLGTIDGLGDMEHGISPGKFTTIDPPPTPTR